MEVLPQLGSVVISANNPQDVEAIRKIIQYLEGLRKISEVELQLVPLQHGDATDMTATLNQIFSRLSVTPNGITDIQAGRGGTGGFGGGFGGMGGANALLNVQAQSILLLAVPRFNAIFVGAAKGVIGRVLEEIKKLDQPTSKDMQPNEILLKKANAGKVAQQIIQLYAQRYPPGTGMQNQVRLVWDDSKNSIYVQAAPADLAEIKKLVSQIDSETTESRNDLRIVPLRVALSDELVLILLEALASNVYTSNQVGVPAVSTTTGAGGVGLGTTGLAAGRGGLNLGGTSSTTSVTGLPATRSTVLRFLKGRDNNKTVVESGWLEDVHIISEAPDQRPARDCPRKDDGPDHGLDQGTGSGTRTDQGPDLRLPIEEGGRHERGHHAPATLPGHDLQHHGS